MDVTADIRGIVPIWDIGSTIQQPLLDDWAEQRELHDDKDPPFYGIIQPTRHVLEWLIDHEPDAAGHAIGRTIGEASHRFGISREVSEKSIQMALSKTGAARGPRREFLNRVLSPDTPSPAPDRTHEGK